MSSRSVSVSVPKGRLLEVACMVVVIGSIVVAVVAVLFWPRVDGIHKCGPHLRSSSVDISHAQVTASGGYNTPDGTHYPQGTYWREGDSIFGCICLIKPCFRMCCPPINPSPLLSSKENQSTCNYDIPPSFNSHLRNLTKTVDRDNYNFHILFGECLNPLHLDPETYDDDEHYILEDGSIEVKDHYNFETFIRKDHSEYCLEYNRSNEYLSTMLCNMLDEEKKDASPAYDHYRYKLLATGLSVSVPCLITTLVVYLALPPLQNLHGKALICHVTCLTVAFTLLAAVLFNVIKVNTPWCMVTALTMLFAFLGSFFWLNVMCFDIWLVFSGLMQPLRGCGTLRQWDHRKFLWYSAYAVGGPLLVTALIAVLELSTWVPDNVVRPHFNERSCWYNDRDAEVLTFYLPIGCLLCHNMMMFATTSCRIRSQTSNKSFHGESRRHSRDHSRVDRTRFFLHLKLFLVMGLYWLVEVLNFVLNNPPGMLWLVMDIGNTLQGVFVFIIFVARSKRTLKLLRQRFSTGFPPISHRPTLSDSHTMSTTINRSFSSIKLTSFITNSNK